MKKVSLLGAAVCAAALLGANIGTASAQGQVERGPEHARSICSFSGLNDEPDDPVEGGRVQSYGQIVKQGHKSQVSSPGFACNPNNISLK